MKQLERKTRREYRDEILIRYVLKSRWTDQKFLWREFQKWQKRCKKCGDKTTIGEFVKQHYKIIKQLYDNKASEAQ